MYYNGTNLNLEEYFETKMNESGFTDESIESVKGYFRDEAEWNFIADYISSCGLENEEDIAFVHKMGYTEEDFANEDELEEEKVTV